MCLADISSLPDSDDAPSLAVVGVIASVMGVRFGVQQVTDHPLLGITTSR